MGMDRPLHDVRPTAMDLCPALLDALAFGGLELAYQPQLRLRDGRPCGAEALIRWTHPVWGAISPGQFIPLAEEQGMIGMIGHWVLEQGCRFLAEADAKGFPLPRLAINLSPRELFDEDLPERLRATAARYGIVTSRLELEITESALVTDFDGAVAMLHRLRGLGATIAVDDFGTGYSSLAYLRKLPVDMLKLDREFIREIDKSRVDCRIVRTVAALGHSLGLTVLAEGVERPEQAACLRRCHVDVVQGFLYAQPLKCGALFDWLHGADFPAAPLSSFPLPSPALPY